MTEQIPEAPDVVAPVETPTAPVETPTAPVETPTVTVETPTAPVETHSVQVLPSSGACETSFDPGAITSTIREFIGTPSCGYEYLEYAFAGGVMLILFAFVTSFFIGFSKMMGAK